MRRILSLVLVAVMLIGVVPIAMAADIYTKTVTGMQGPMTLELTVNDGKIEELRVIDQVETPGIGSVAANLIPERIKENQSINVDVITGATVTSMVIKNAVENMLKDAGLDVAQFSGKPEKAESKDQELSADVVIVGGGGAGLASAVSAGKQGVSVILIEKTGFLGGNSIVSGGIYNAPDPEFQDKYTEKIAIEQMMEPALAEAPVSDEHKALVEAVRGEYEAFKMSGKNLYDSPNWFALQTWNGGDKVAELKMVQTLANNAFSGLEWLRGMGMVFEDRVFHGAGSLYPRTHASVEPNGTGYIRTFVETLEKMDNVKILMDTTGTTLVAEEGRVNGVIATAKDGSQIKLHAKKGVILTTGGFAGNVKLRQEYCEGDKWPDLGPQIPTSNVSGVTGDGIFMARDVGADLVNMDQIQLLHCCNPQTGATYDITSVSMSNVFINKNGERFVREDGRRDVMSKAIIQQPDGIMYILFSADLAPDASAAKTLGGQSLQYYLDNNLAGYKKGDTLAELAEAIGVPADKLEKTVADYNGYVENGNDPFGRLSFSGKITTGPYYAYPRSPAVHHTMGGVRIDESAHALDKDGNPIPGLYCAGEITGNIHGGNRLGGNAIVDFTVFGRIAGESIVKDN